ncbi:MAG TPA: S41 family peptidase, partial [Bacteroidales bacterium]|nr:S41 family peptidase [Bacteroidales bacterium]
MIALRTIIPLLLTFIHITTASAQNIPDSVYYQRLYHTCKVWGYVKYFHTSMENCDIDWDSVLIAKLPLIQAEPTQQGFKDILLDMVMAPGDMGIPGGPAPNIPDSLFFNLHLEWFNDTALSQPIHDALDTIRVRFRPQGNCYVTPTPGTGQPNFANDIAYNSTGLYPDPEIRLLALFRYWNAIEYFFPYTDIMDQDWDTTLVEMIPYFYEAQDGTDYALAILRLAHRIDDTHGFTNSSMAQQYFGMYYPRFWARQADGKMVVAHVEESVSNIVPGDIILQMDGIDIEDYKDSLRPFMAVSNESRMQYNLNNTVIRGDYGSFTLFLQNENGTRVETTSRTYSGSAFISMLQNTGPVWYDTLLPGGCNYGYVDMGRLEQGDVDDMFSELWETDAIVFDIRSYPQGTLWIIVNYIYTGSIHIANFTVPQSDYPGTIDWHHEYIGAGTSNPYEGSIIILFDERTLSQAEYTCMGFDYHPKCIKIGSQTAGADGNVTQVYLPGQISVYFTGLGTFYADYTQTQRIGIVPDHEVKPTVQGLREQRDELLEYAMDCGFVSMDEESVADDISVVVFPNPVSDVLNIHVKRINNCRIKTELFSIDGRKLLEFANDDLSADIRRMTIDVGELPTGIY